MSNPLYNAGIALYGLAARVAALRSAKVKAMLRGQGEAIATLRARREALGIDGFDVWFHAASLGEFEQARPLIERLKQHRPDTTILLTFFSPSGYKVRHNYAKVDAVTYLPMDSPAKVSAFLDAARPKMAVFVKYEFWANYISAIHRRGIPLYLISAIFRPGQRFFRPGGSMWQKMLKCYDRLYVQDRRSRELLSSIGVDNVTVAGDTRFDRVTDVMRSTVDVAAARNLSSQYDFTLVAGSSWPADEDCYIPWLMSHHNVCAIIAPHEYDGRRLEALRECLGRKHTLLLSECSADGTVPPMVRYLIVDCFGLLCSLYRYATVAYIGGGFGAGIHNINEAAVYGAPVVFGPNNRKFKEAADLQACGGGFCVKSAEHTAAVLDSLLSDHRATADAGAAAARYIKEHLGATDVIYSDLFGA